MARATISGDHKVLLTNLYVRLRRTRDDLPYTEDFEKLYVEFVARSGLTLDRHAVWRALASIGKAAELPRKAR